MDGVDGQRSFAVASSSRNSSIDPTELTGPVPSSNKRAKLTAHQQQAQAISKLLEHPEREVKMPTGPREKSIRPPRDVMKNVTGSSAGAGSGEFHVYKQQRRREYERIQLMEEEAQKVGFFSCSMRFVPLKVSLASSPPTSQPCHVPEIYGS